MSQQLKKLYDIGRTMSNHPDAATLLVDNLSTVKEKLNQALFKRTKAHVSVRGKA